MPRLPYAEHLAPGGAEEDAITLERIKARRGASGLIELDKMLLHAPPIAHGWNELLGTVRLRTTLNADIRETIICRVAALNRAQYEWDQHLPLLEAALRASSSTRVCDDQAMAEYFKALRNTEVDNPSSLSIPWTTSYKELVRYVDAMTTTVTVPDEVFELLRGTLPDGKAGDRQMVEITVTCASYNCVSRFLVALHVGDVVWKD